MLLLRKILFPVFVLGYLVFCPLIILRALGIVYNPESQKSIVKTGLISIATIPPGASLYIDGALFPGKTPAVLRNLTEGHYSIEIVLDHHRRWEKTIPVIASRATALENVILIPREWEPQRLTSPKFHNLIPLEGNPYFLLSANGHLKDLSVYRWRDENGEKEPQKPLSFFPEGSPYGRATLLSATTVPHSPFLVMRTTGEKGKKFLWADPREDPVKVRDITYLFPHVPDEIAWDPQGGTDLIVRDQDDLSRLVMDEKTIFPKIIRNIRGFGLQNKKIYAVTNSALKIFNNDGDTIQIIPHPPELIAHLLESQGHYALRLLRDDIFILSGEDGRLLMNRPPYRLLEKGLAGQTLNSKTRQWLLWTGTKIGILDFPAEESGEKSAAGPRLTWVIQNGRDIGQAFWVNEGSHILYRDQNSISLIELRPFDEPAVYELLHVKRNSAIDYSDKDGRLFFLGEDDGRLYAVDILPRPTVSPITVREEPRTGE